MDSSEISHQTSFAAPTPIPNIRTHIILNKKLVALGLQIPFQTILPSAMEKAIKEIMPPVVERSVAIAMQSTIELVLKDFAMEADESRIYNAAHLMVASLAGSLAHVTCKEPLRIAISSHLRSSLQSLNIANDFLERAVQIVTNDNLDLGCTAVEHAASDKAEQTIDGEITGQLAGKRKQKESGGAPYFEATTYTQGSFSESLLAKPGRLSLTQQRVYEGFATYPWQNQSSQSSTSMPLVPSASSVLSGSSGLSRSYGPSTGQINSSNYPSSQPGPGFNAVHNR